MKRKSGNELFEEIKVKMAMKIHRLSRAKAKELIAKRCVADAANGGDYRVKVESAYQRNLFRDSLNLFDD